MTKLIIKNPVLTEKSTNLYKEQKKATFVVDDDANKVQVGKALEEIYDGVKIGDIRVIVRLGKPKYDRITRSKYRTKNTKIMICDLEEGEIEAFETE